MKGMHISARLLSSTRCFTSRIACLSHTHTQGCDSVQICSQRKAALPTEPRVAAFHSIRKVAFGGQATQDDEFQRRLSRQQAMEKENHRQALASKALDSLLTEEFQGVFAREEGTDNYLYTPASSSSDSSLTRDSHEVHPNLEGIDLVDVGHGPGFHPAYLRDACPCPRCIDPSSRQKNFQTTDIPQDIRASSVEHLDNGDVRIMWANDLPSFDQNHVSIYPEKFFEVHSNSRRYNSDRYDDTPIKPWGKKRITANLRFLTYDQWIKDDAALRHGLLSLKKHGLLIIRGIPKSETAVEELASRMGPIRDTFYGRTWDVKSVPKAKNVAYTHQYLGLHMDLLYMADPPGIQFLHCLENNAKGGESIFSDAFNAAIRINDSDFKELSNSKLAYHYRNAGEHYFHAHPVFVLGNDAWYANKNGFRPIPRHVNYSPPFQANHIYGQSSQHKFASVLKSLRNFAAELESPEALYEYKLKPGECVIFNNRRVLHGRREFEATIGKRWLKGTYVDTDVFESRFRVLQENAIEAKQAGKPWQVEPQYVHPQEHDNYRNEWIVRDAEEDIMRSWSEAPRTSHAASN